MTAGALHYDYIRPEVLPLNRFLFRLRGDAALRKRYLEDPKAVVAEAGLGADEGNAVLARDVPRLVALGAHPLLAILVRIATDVEERPEAFEFY